MSDGELPADEGSVPAAGWVSDESGPVRRAATDAECEAVLLEMLDSFLANELTFDDLETRFVAYYVDEMPENALNDDRYEFFSRVQEKFSWTGHDVDDESRSYGWIDTGEFVGWLSAGRAAYAKASSA